MTSRHFGRDFGDEKEMALDHFAITNGKIALTDRPGIGLELNEDVAKQYQYPNTTWFE